MLTPTSGPFYPPARDERLRTCRPFNTAPQSDERRRFSGAPPRRAPPQGRRTDRTPPVGAWRRYLSPDSPSITYLSPSDLKRRTIRGNLQLNLARL